MVYSLDEKGARTERRTMYGGGKRERGEGWMEVVVIKWEEVIMS